MLRVAGWICVTCALACAPGGVDAARRTAPLVASDCPPGTTVIEGTPGADMLSGTNGADCILGHGGDDTIRGRGGDDILAGGEGNDLIRGGGGNDELYGESGDDELRGGAGDDYLDGGEGSDTLVGNGRTNVLVGGPGSDAFVGVGPSDVAVDWDGDAFVVIDANSGPEITNLSADPTRIDAGETTALFLTVTDPDADALSFEWTSECVGQFDDSAAQSPAFTLRRVDAADCRLSVTAIDERGSESSARIDVATGPAPTPTTP